MYSGRYADLSDLSGWEILECPPVFPMATIRRSVHTVRPMNDPQPILEVAPLDQMEMDTRAKAADFRRLEGKLADLLAEHPGGEVTSAELRPPTLLEVMVSAAELATEQVGNTIGLLRDAAAITNDELFERWLERRGAERRARLAALVNPRVQPLRLVQ